MGSGLWRRAGGLFLTSRAIAAGAPSRSQGQRQRLSLARALARPAPLVLLDEPTAALDESTEQRVLAGIARAVRGRTVVLVTHRAAPLALADQVISLRPGGDPSTNAAPPTTVEPDDAESLTSVGPW